MPSKHFLTNENMKLIWDVLMENELFNNQTKDFLIKINYLVNQNTQPFYEEEINKKQNISLMELNKKFISLLLNHIHQNLLKGQNSKKELVTSEEIQNHKQTQFEKELNQKQKEFTNSMSLPIPPTPEFQDKMDEPLSELELEIKKTMAQRNYDIEMIHHHNIHQNNVADRSWLKPQETSVKKEKLTFQNNAKTSLDPIKYIKIETQEIDPTLVKKEMVDLEAPKKHISWADETQPTLLETDLFSKLKMLPSNNNNENEDTSAAIEKRMDKMEHKLEKIEQMLQLLLKKNEDYLL